MKMTATSGIQKFAEGEIEHLSKYWGGRQHRTTPAGQILGGRDPYNPCGATPIKFHFNLGLNFGLNNCDVKQPIYT